MQELLSRLTAIHHFSKTIHYKSEGESFYGDHLLADRLGDGLDGFKDSINEVCFLGEGVPTPLSKDVLEGAIKFLPDEKKKCFELLGEMDDLIVDTLEHIQDLTGSKDEGKLSVGEENLLGGIAEDLQLKHGLLVLRLKQARL